jgi:sialic acid synthase SpsE/mannose-6-phosphate isomerase-like protein (cupin superfamily)
LLQTPLKIIFLISNKADHMIAKIPNDLFVFEMANNHMGDISHGIEVIRRFGELARNFPEFKFAFKLQYRDLDTFIHPKMRGREDVHYIKRFSDTRLTKENFDTLVSEMRSNGFFAMSTPFDEKSVDLIESQELDIIKIASCSFNDWPLLERVSEAAQPIIASTAGASLEDIDRVVSFFQHRNKEFAILHCVGEYPTADEKMHVSQIEYLRNRYPGVRVGFSTHENPSNTDIIKMAIAKGAQIFEKHVGVPTEKYALNAYSINPDQARAWLESARYAKIVCGVGDKRLPSNESEIASLRSLRRGVFVNRDVNAGEEITRDDVYFAFPPEDGQFTANDWSKYSSYAAKQPISKDSAIMPKNTLRDDVRSKVWQAAQEVKSLLETSGITVPGGVDLELSHHYGIDRFHEVGLTLITVVNRGYCKKLLVSLPGQFHPEQFHNQKEETFHVLYGNVDLTLDGETSTFQTGDVINIEPGVRHAFVSQTGCVIEEISTTHFVNDSFYTDEAINQNKNRKTLLTYWMS